MKWFQKAVSYILPVLSRKCYHQQIRYCLRSSLAGLILGIALSNCQQNTTNVDLSWTCLKGLTHTEPHTQLQKQPINHGSWSTFHTSCSSLLMSSLIWIEKQCLLSLYVPSLHKGNLHTLQYYSVTHSFCFSVYKIYLHLCTLELLFHRLFSCECVTVVVLRIILAWSCNTFTFPQTVLFPLSNSLFIEELDIVLLTWAVVGGKSTY